MRIGVDATSWANGRGYGRFTREVLTAMVALEEAREHELVLFVEKGGEDSLAKLAASDHVRVVPVELSVAPTKAAAADDYRSPRDMLRLTRAVKREPLDVFFSPTVYTYFPLPLGLRACVCVHDAIAERFPELTLPSRRARVFWNLKVKLALWQADLVLTVSETARSDLVRVLRVPEARLRVAVEAPAPGFAPRTPDEVAEAARSVELPEGARWLVYVGGFNPHKHVDLLVRAHAALADEGVHLLLVGSVSEDVFHGDGARIRAAIEECGTEGHVHWCGFVDDDRLAALHTGSIGCVLASACEGFGLPAVEAAACGAPSIVTTESPLPQLLEGGCLPVRPGDQAQLDAAVRRLAAEAGERAAMGKRALERARTLSWPRAARQTLAAILEAAGAKEHAA